MNRTVSDIGERGIIELFHKIFEDMPDTPVPFGDDVSALKYGEDLVVVKCDMLVGKTDIPKGMNFRQAGRKAVVSTVSDFASKGVSPQALMASIGLPGGFSLNELEDLAKGLNEGAREYSAYLIGGDTNEADDVIVDCIGLGFTKSGRLILRCGAQPGDILATTGTFGDTSAGLRMLADGLKVPSKIRDRLEQAVYNPRAQLREGLALGEYGMVTASIDSSDGLSWSLYELSRCSNVGFNITYVPISEAAIGFAEEAGLDPLDLALHGGEEFNLVFTIKEEGWERVKKVIADVGGEVYRLGEVISGQKIYLEVDGERRKVKPFGWEHLRRG